MSRSSRCISNLDELLDRPVRTREDMTIGAGSGIIPLHTQLRASAAFGYELGSRSRGNPHSFEISARRSAQRRLRGMTIPASTVVAVQDRWTIQAWC